MVLYRGIAWFALLLHATCNTGDTDEAVNQNVDTDNDHDEYVVDDRNGEEDNV